MVMGTDFMVSKLKAEDEFKASTPTMEFVIFFLLTWSMLHHAKDLGLFSLLAPIKFLAKKPAVNTVLIKWSDVYYKA